VVESFVVHPTDLNIECRTPGISGFMRIRDEEDFLALAIESHLPFLDELVIVLNRCTDRSPAIAEDYRRRYPKKIRVYHYEPFVHVVGSDEYMRLPADSPHSLVNYYNYALSKTTREIALKVDGDHIAIPTKFDNLMRLIRGRQIDRLLFRKRFNCYLTFRGLNLWDKDGRIYVNTLDAMTGGDDCGFFPVTRETWYTHDPRFEVLHVGNLRRSALPEVCFYHTKLMKKDRGMANLDLDKYPNSYLVELMRGRYFIPQLVLFEEYCARENAAKGLPPPAELGIKPLWTR
jgi:hypothetical protein